MKPVRHSIGLLGAAAALAIILWGYWGSKREPAGCYRVDDQSFLAIADKSVRFFKSGQLKEQRRIVRIDRIRGYVLTLDENISINSAAGTMTLVILEDGRDTPHIALQRRGQEPLKFYEFPCDPGAPDPAKF